MTRRRTSPELIEDVIGEILLRIPPDSSAYLARASMVCKIWRRIVSDPDFTRRYSEFHRTPPLLGFFHNFDHGILFHPTVATCPFPQPAFDNSRWLNLDDRRLRALDCRHGRVLLAHSHPKILFVWDPITGIREQLPLPKHQNRYAYYSAMVLCAVAGCNHCDCHGGPFIVIFVGGRRGSMHGCVYSSKDRAWGTPFSVTIGGGYSYRPGRYSALVGDHAYFTLRKAIFRETITLCKSTGILKYDLGENFFSMVNIDLPLDMCYWNVFTMPMEDGSLGFAGIRDSSLYLWQR
ncbi:unnamed protein product [Urochloa humidicola]